MNNDGDFVLLCYSRNSPYSYDAHTPLSILCLGTFLETKGVRVEYFDERIDGIGRLGELLKLKPLLVGFSVIGGYQIVSAAKLSRLVRRLSPGSKIVWGGISPTTLPELTAREDFVDYVVIGEGEETILELYMDLKNKNGRTALIHGLAWSKEGEFLRTPERPPPDVESLPFVYQGKAAGMLARYMKRRSVREAVGYEISRGCPFLCTFCYSPGFHNQTRAKSTAKAAEELDRLKTLGANDLDIYDDTLFGARRRDFPEYLDLLRNGKFAWIGNLRINMLDEDLLRRIESSGCKWLYFGIESDEDVVLKAIKKGYTAAAVKEGLRVIGRSSLPTVFSLIYGLPLQGEKDKLGHYLDFAENLHRHHPKAEIQIQSYVPLPGNELYAEAIRWGFKPPRHLLEWADQDHFKVANPWLEDPALANKVYISSFLAFRYRRHLSHFPVNLLAYPLHRLSLWRVRKHFFKFHAESLAYNLVLALSQIFANIYFGMRNILLRLLLLAPKRTRACAE